MYSESCEYEHESKLSNPESNEPLHNYISGVKDTLNSLHGFIC